MPGMKKYLSGLFLFTSFILLLSLSSVVLAFDAASTTATYYSDITQANNDKFFAAIKNRTIKTLRVNTSGGEVEAAIALARWIYKHKIDIEVVELCLSSCANYLFTAAKHKTIRPGAIVAWHGNYHHLQHTGLWRDDIVSRMKRTGESRVEAKAKVLAQVNHLVKLERDFFDLIGVDQKLCWVGKMPPYNARNYYFLSKTDMQRFGVRNVILPNDYEKTDVEKFDPHIVYIELNDQDLRDTN